MKRYILPILLVLVGSVLLISYKVVSDDPSTHSTGLTNCSQAETNCSTSQPTTLAIATAYGALLGVISVPAGVAIGVYRIFVKKRSARPQVK